MRWSTSTFINGKKRFKEAMHKSSLAAPRGNLALGQWIERKGDRSGETESYPPGGATPQGRFRKFSSLETIHGTA